MNYPSLNSLFPQQGRVDPYKYGSGLIFVNGKMFDETTGKFVNNGRTEQQIKKNPFNLHLGNLINPFIDYSPLKKMANMGLDRSGSLLNG